MPDVEIRADYDRDGRLTGRRTEYAARSTVPGAIVVANLDRDGRRLPRSVSPARPVALDAAASTKRGDDLDPLQLVVDVSPQGVALMTSLGLRIRGENARSVALIDARGRVVSPTASGPDVVDFSLPLQAARHRFRLESRLPPGSPLGAADGALAVEVVGIDILGNELEMDRGLFQLAPFIVLDDLAPASQLFICEIGENAPSIADVETALESASPRPGLVRVPLSVSSGDAWLQDQFQLGYFRAPGQTMPVILHLPRMRSNTLVAQADQQNLGEFVRSHFPSTDLGLIEDFWKRDLPIRHLAGETRLPFPATGEVLRILRKLDVAEQMMRLAIDHLCAQAVSQAQPGASAPAAMAQPAECRDLPTARSAGIRRTQLADLLRRVDALARKVKAGVPAHDRDRIDGLRDACRDAVKDVEAVLAVRQGTAGAVFDVVLTSGTVTMDGGDLEDLATNVSRMHDSLVYGGNIEASPPVRDAPLGKIVIGEGDERIMDPPLRDMLGPPTPTQPVVPIDTTWLYVGHVDELIAFLPDLGARGRHVLLRASPEVARALIDKASELYVSGLSDVHIDADRAFWRPLTISRHLMHESTHPITRMFRGKHWLHYHPPRPTDVVPPPHIYRRLVDFYSGLLSDSLAPIIPEAKDEADYYPAALSAWDWRFFDRGSNARIVEERLVPLDEKLGAAFPGIDVLRVPVLFDRTDEIGVEMTAALSPNLVNLQFVNGTVIIPRPFGPRMQPSDAIVVVRSVLAEQGLSRLAGRFTAAFIRRERLAVTEVWVNRELGISGHSFSNAKGLAKEFRDGWPKKATRDEIEAQIVKRNRREFDRRGELRPGWRRIVIPENTVDLFEGYTHVLLRSLGIRPGWVDSWYYHVRMGEIHCGTNVLRTPPRGLPPWWDVIRN